MVRAALGSMATWGLLGAAVGQLAVPQTGANYSVTVAGKTWFSASGTESCSLSPSNSSLTTDTIVQESWVGCRGHRGVCEQRERGRSLWRPVSASVPFRLSYSPLLDSLSTIVRVAVFRQLTDSPGIAQRRGTSRGARCTAPRTGASCSKQPPPSPAATVRGPTVESAPHTRSKAANRRRWKPLSASVRLLSSYPCSDPRHRRVWRLCTLLRI